MSRTLTWLRREGRISLEMLQWKRATSHVEGRISLFFSSCDGVPLEFRWGPQGPARGALGRSSLHASLEGSLGFPWQSLSLPRSSSGVEAATSGFLSREDMDLRIPLGRPQWNQGLVSCGAMQVRSSLDSENQYQASCQVDHSDRWLSFRGHRAVTPAIVF